MLKKILSVALTTAILSVPSLAFEQNGVKKGQNSVSASFRHAELSPDYEDASSSYLTAMDAKYSYFVTDNVEIGFGLGYMLTNSNDDKTKIVTAMPFVNYNFTLESKTLVPYVGAGASFLAYNYQEGYGPGTSGESSNFDDTAGTFEIGLKVFAAENLAIVPAYHVLSYENFMNHGVKVGIQFFF